MPNHFLAKLLRTRLLVAALGESLPSPWWRTRFLQTVGLTRLERIVPRTARLAALKGATAGARRDHDALVAPHSYHLFRLPSSIEHRLRFLAESGATNDPLLLTVPPNVDEILLELAPVADLPIAGIGSGPRRMAKIDEISTDTVLTSLAFAYAHAARSSYRTQPFFES